MDLHPVDIIISLINIVVLFILLRLILWKHVIRFLSEREQRVIGEMDNAEKRRFEAEALHSDYDKKIEKIEERGRDLVRESQSKASEEAERIFKETRDKAQNMINDAELRIAQEKEQALEDSQAEVTQLATEMASRILEREISLEDNAHVVDNFFSK